MKKTYNITPVAKPRMTQRDKWAKRPCVLKYWAFKDEIKRLGVKLPKEGFRATFVIPLPKYLKKDRSIVDLPHCCRPDLDNYVKSLLDSVFSEDSHVWNIHAIKIWGNAGQIIIEDI